MKMRSLIRRYAVAMAVLLPFGAGVAKAQVPLDLRLDWAAAGYHAPIYLAIEKGWFAKEGISVKVVDGNGSNATVQLVDAGHVDVGFAAVSSMAFVRAKGAKITSIAGIFRKGDLAMMVPKDSNIMSVKDLKGKLVLTPAGSFEAPFLDAFFATGGLKRSDLNLTTVDISARLPMYLTGKADAIFASTAFNWVIAEAQKPSRLIQFSDVGLNLPGFGVVVSEATLAKKGEALKKFASVLAGSWGYVLKGHQEEAITAMLKIREQARLDPKILRGQLKDSLPFLYTDATKDQPVGVQTDKDWVETIKVMENADTIGKGTK